MIVPMGIGNSRATEGIRGGDVDGTQVMKGRHLVPPAVARKLAVRNPLHLLSHLPLFYLQSKGKSNKGQAKD
jgi:hypothetical protein